MDTVKHLAPANLIADLVQQVDPGALVHRRPRQAGDARDQVAIDRSNRAICRSADLMMMTARLEHILAPALGIDQPFHGSQRLARTQQFHRPRIAASAYQSGIEFEHAAGKHERALPEVCRCVVVIAQDSHDVPRFQHRTDTAPDWLRAVGEDHIEDQAELVPDILEQLAQANGFALRAHLGARPDRNIDQQVR